MRNDRKSSPSAGKIIGIIIALALFSPELFGVLAVIALIAAPFYLIFRLRMSGRGNPRTRKPEPFDDCPKPICFHRDKGEHHIRRGKEIDPWDRPDIDISKYQRR